MQEIEYETMARAEEDHWWYLGLRDLLARTLIRPDLGLTDGARLLDAGCGTGVNLRLLDGIFHPSYLGGFDASESALEWARRKAPAADLYLGDICEPEIHGAQLDLITILDVIYIPGARRAHEGLRRLVAALRPGGLFVVHLPAYDWLFSEHDVATHTTERYTSARVRQLLTALELEIVLLTYRLFWLLPIVATVRLPDKIRHRRIPAAARSDLHRRPSRVLNRALFSILRHENHRIAAGGRYPWGSSVFAVGRRAE